MSVLKQCSSVTWKQKKWDAIIVGGGHNGLTAAAYLARVGLSVLVLERRHLVGGAAVTEEIVPGFRFSRCSYLQGLLRPSIVNELKLRKHGLKLLKRDPSSFTPSLDGHYLLLGRDPLQNYSEIAKFSKKDALSYSRYEKQLEKFCCFMDFILDLPTPETRHDCMPFFHRLRQKLFNSLYWIRYLQQTFALGQKDMVDFVALLVSPASKILNSWFEAGILKATLATDAIIGNMGSIHAPGSGYVLLHHIMGETDGERGVWSYAEGGMGSVSLAIGHAAAEAGAHIVTNAEVSQVIIDDTGDVKGVRMVDGTEILSSVVLSNATPYLTFTKLVRQDLLPGNFVHAIESADYSSGCTKFNIAVDRLPHFRCYKSTSLSAGPQHVGTIHIGAECMEDMESALRDAWNCFPSRRPLIEMTIPSVLDKTISPTGKHVINLFVQYTPYKVLDGSWEDSSYKESFAHRCFSLIDEYAPGFSTSIIDYDMLSPVDLERDFGLTGGNIFHGALGLDSLFLLRPVKGWSNYRTPVRGLYLCGSGVHPGGGVMGAPGRNAAHVVIHDMKMSGTF